MDWRDVLGFIATLLALVQAVPYIVSILRGRTRPSATSYLLWASVAALEAGAYVSVLGFTPAAWPRIAFALTGITILILSLSKGRRTSFTAFEAWSLVAAGLGGVVWLVFNAPIASMLVSAGVVGLAYATTIRKLVAHPGTEDITAWGLTTVSGVLNIIVLTTFSVPVLLPLLVTVGGAGIVTWLAAAHRRKPETERAHGASAHVFET